VDNGLHSATEDPREASTNSRLVVQAQILLHKQRKRVESFFIGR